MRLCIYMKPLTDRDLGWLEGIIDGEGCLGLYKNKRNDRPSGRGFVWVTALQIGSTDLKIVNRVRELLGTGGITLNRRPKEQNARVLYLFRAGSGCLRELHPVLHLTSKQLQRDLLIEACKLVAEHKAGLWHLGGKRTHDGRLEEIHTEMKRLNHRGLPEHSNTREE